MVIFNEDEKMMLEDIIPPSLPNMPIIERVFAYLVTLYGARFADFWNGCNIDEVKRVWAYELSDCAEDEIMRGLRACKQLNWPPTLPEFLKLCRPNANANLHYEDAFVEAVKQMWNRQQNQPESWSHPAVYWASVRLGNDLHAYPYAVIKERWQNALDQAIQDVKEGRVPQTIPPRRDVLPRPGRSTLTRDEIKDRLMELRRAIGLSISAPPTQTKP